MRELPLFNNVVLFGNSGNGNAGNNNVLIGSAANAVAAVAQAFAL